MKRLLTRLALMTAVCLFSSVTLAAGSYPRLTFGAESSFISTFLSYRHFNFVSAYGYRVDRESVTTGCHVNSEILLHLGCNLSENINISLYSGYGGAGKHERFFPVSLRLTYLFGKDPMKGRWLAFADGGSGLKDSKERTSPVFSGKIGGGYRISLSRSSKLDFLISVRGVKAKTSVFETANSSIEHVSEDRLRRNNAVYVSLSVGIGLTF